MLFFRQQYTPAMKPPVVRSVLMAMVLIILVSVLALVNRMETVAARVGGAPAHTKIRWLLKPTACHPPKMVAECVVRVKKIPGFGPVSASERAELAKFARSMSSKYKVVLTAETLVSIRTMELAASGRNIHARPRGVVAAYRHGDSVMEIATRFRVPPQTVLRQILYELGYDNKQIKNMISDPSTLPARLAEEATAVFEADLGSRVNAERIRVKSQAYEDAVGEHLRGRGLNFETEEQLRLAQIAKCGAPRITPDFLFTRPIHIDGQEVNWLDAKDYPMYGCRLVASGLEKQAVKYTTRFGPGAMVFNGGVMCGARVVSEKTSHPPLLLDGTHIAVSL